MSEERRAALIPILYGLPKMTYIHAEVIHVPRIGERVRLMRSGRHRGFHRVTDVMTVHRIQKPEDPHGWEFASHPMVYVELEPIVETKKKPTKPRAKAKAEA